MLSDGEPSCRCPLHQHGLVGRGSGSGVEGRTGSQQLEGLGAARLSLWEPGNRPLDVAHLAPSRLAAWSLEGGNMALEAVADWLAVSHWSEAVADWLLGTE